MRRRPLSTRGRQALWDRECALTGSVPICNLCGAPVCTGQAWEESHWPVPRAWGGTATGIAHRRCNRRHGAAIVTPLAAKVKRVEARHVGAFRSRHPMVCGRGSKLSKTFNHGVVLRLTQGEKLAATLAGREIR